MNERCRVPRGKVGNRHKKLLKPCPQECIEACWGVGSEEHFFFGYFGSIDQRTYPVCLIFIGAGKTVFCPASAQPRFSVEEKKIVFQGSPRFLRLPALIVSCTPHTHLFTESSRHKMSQKALVLPPALRTLRFRFPGH